METSKEYFEFELTPSQQKAFEALMEFALSADEKVFILKGYAGTGKTTLVGGYIKWLKESQKSFSLLASTGRAAKVLSDKTKVEVETVHSHIFLFSNFTQDLATMSAVETKNEKSVHLNYRLKDNANNPDGHIYIVDEASMISDVIVKNSSFAEFGSGKLLVDLFDYDKEGKFIFIGDPKQLPPVGQHYSPALTAEHIKQEYGFNTAQFELTTIMRQKDANDIIKASMVIRKLHEINPHVKFASFPLKGYNDIKLHHSAIDLVNRYMASIVEFGFDYATMICHTNKQCSDFNHLIRMTLGKPAEKPIAGDILMVTQNNQKAGLVNGDFVEITEVRSLRYYCGLNFLQVRLKELVSKSETESLLIEDILFTDEVNITQHQNKTLLIDFYHRMKAEGISTNDVEFYEKMRSDPFLNAIKAKFGYAVTCHKSQGGEWQEVFLFMNNNIHGIPKPGIYQWLYTAVTRAKKTLHLVDDWYIHSPDAIFQRIK